MNITFRGQLPLNIYFGANLNAEIWLKCCHLLAMSTDVVSRWIALSDEICSGVQDTENWLGLAGGKWEPSVSINF